MLGHNSRDACRSKPVSSRSPSAVPPARRSMVQVPMRFNMVFAFDCDILLRFDVSRAVLRAPRRHGAQLVLRLLWQIRCPFDPA